MEFSIKLTRQEKEFYISVCELIWGCIPIDVDWAKGTKIYKEAEEKQLKKKFTIDYYEKILDNKGNELNTPARIDHKTGNIEIKTK